MWKVEHHYSIQTTTGKAEFISIKRDEPYCVITDKLSGDYSESSDETLIHEVLEAFYKKLTSTVQKQKHFKRWMSA